MSSVVANDLPLVLREGRALLGGGDASRFSQPRMAELLGVSLRQYQRWERGVSQPRPRDVERIREVLDGAAGGDTLRDEVALLRQQVRTLRRDVEALRARLAS